MLAIERQESNVKNGENNAKLVTGWLGGRASAS